jgi:hypothetical protein
MVALKRGCGNKTVSSARQWTRMTMLTAVCTTAQVMHEQNDDDDDDDDDDKKNMCELEAASQASCADGEGQVGAKAEWGNGGTRHGTHGQESEGKRS